MSGFGALSWSETLLLGLLVFVCGWGLGYIADGFMQELGLGPAANGIIIGCGVWLGLYLRYRYFMPPANFNVPLTVVFSAGAPIALLVALGFAKAKVL
jgi:hypothetical protein